MMASIARRVRVTGRVQGVFFRAWTREEARTLHVSGWVRNCSDGSVEAQLEGDLGAVEAVIELMREGPPGAEVESVQVEEADPEGLSGFEVRH
jgi:acylphosphatase